MSILWIDQKYASLVGTQLEQFKVVKTKPYIAKFRCPVCGDSQRNRFKTRGHFYEHNGHINYKCFNCDASTSLSKFIKTQNPSLYTEYRLEVLKETGGANTNFEEEKFIPAIEKFSSRRIDSFDPFKELHKISQLKPNHPAKLYVQERKIPPSTHFRIYYSPTYYHWVNSILPGKFSEKAVALDEPRIVFPFIDSKGYVFGFTGRSLSKTSNMRYSTIILDDTKEKVFGLDTINKTKNVYVVEGPIDSLFLDNCIAMAGSDINLNNIAEKDKITVVYDNEPRNKEIIKKISKAVEQGYKVCIWPEYIEQKDINDMVLKQDLPGPAVQAIIDQNTFTGLAAKMRLQQWSKI
jgi:DNA primase